VLQSCTSASWMESLALLNAWSTLLTTPTSFRSLEEPSSCAFWNSSSHSRWKWPTFQSFCSNEPYQHRAQLHRNRNHRLVRLVFVCFTTQRSLQVTDREEHRWGSFVHPPYNIKQMWSRRPIWPQGRRRKFQKTTNLVHGPELAQQDWMGSLQNS